MPKKFTQTADGWIQVEEAPEDELDVLIKEIDKIIDGDKLINNDETKKIPVIADQMPELKTTECKIAKRINDKKDLNRTLKRNTKQEDWDWEKQATKDAMWCSLIVLGVVGLITGIVALIIYFSPLTLNDVAEGIAFGVIKTIIWFYEIFYNCVASLCEWIMTQCGGSF